jgi:microcystin-dependent protein
MATNDFIPFATGGSANVESQADYILDPQVPIGQQPGIAKSALNNKALRQGTYIASCIAQFLSNMTGDSVLDDGTQSEVLATMAKIWPAPTGAVLPFAGSVAPTGFLLADGSAVSRTTYANLFAVVGVVYGPGDGSTTFNLPNTQGVFVRGAGTQTIGSTSYTGTPGSSENDEVGAHTVAIGVVSNIAGSVQGGANAIPQSNQSINNAESIAQLTGVETQPANICLNYIIKT